MLEVIGLGRVGPSFWAAYLSQGDYLRSPLARIPRTGRESVRKMKERLELRLEHGTLRDDAVRHITPEGHEQFARQRYDRNPPNPAARWPDALEKPPAEV